MLRAPSLGRRRRRGKRELTETCLKCYQTFEIPPTCSIIYVSFLFLFIYFQLAVVCEPGPGSSGAVSKRKNMKLKKKTPSSFHSFVSEMN